MHHSTDLSRPIGIFDSGIGGLTVAGAICDLLENESILYFGDTAHLPYGEKSPELIRRYSTTIARHLLSSGCKAIVVACNSASSNALDQIRSVVGDAIPVIDMVHPVVEHLSKAYPTSKIGLIGTRATISSKLYTRALDETSNGSIELISRATPLLASAIEEGFFNNTIPKAVLEAYLNDGYFNNVDAMILGCTHYPLVRDDVKSLLLDKVTVINSPLIIANTLNNKLEELNLQASDSHTPENHFQVSDLTENFELGARRFFGSGINLEEITLRS